MRLYAALVLLTSILACWSATDAQVRVAQAEARRSLWAGLLTSPSTPARTQAVLKSALARQRYFCADAYPSDVDKFKKSHVFGERGGRAVPGQTPFWLYVRYGPDIVSEQIMETGTWAKDLLKDIFWALSYDPGAGGGSGAGAGAGAAGTGFAPANGEPPVFVDVGANFGWLALNAASRGYRVAAVEAMRGNQKMLRNSLCAQPPVGERVVLLASGASNESATCFIFSDPNNAGNGQSLCGLSAEAAQAALPRGHVIRDEIPMQRLDAMLGGVEVQVLKIDVEGFEPLVMYGATEMLRAGKIKFICMEFFPDLQQRNTRNPNATVEFIDFLLSLPYRLSITGFEGGYLPRSQAAAALRGQRTRDDIFLAHEGLPLVAGVP